MIKVQNINLYDIIPQVLKNDKTTVAICKVLQKYIDENFKLLNKLILLPNIDNLEEDILDHLAYQFHVDFYDSSLDISKKREIVKGSIAHHRKKGTKWSVEDLISRAFDNSWIDEWFDYNGKPYMFKVTTTDYMSTKDKLTSLIRAIGTVKNTRSWLESITIKREKELKLYCGSVTRRTIKTTIYPRVTNQYDSQLNYGNITLRIKKREIKSNTKLRNSNQSVLKLGNALHKARKHKIHPKEA